MTDLTTTTAIPTHRIPSVGVPTNILFTREPQSTFGWARLKTVHVPAGWYPRMAPYEDILIRVEEQTGTIDGWWGLHGESVNVCVKIAAE